MHCDQEKAISKKSFHSINVKHLAFEISIVGRRSQCHRLEIILQSEGKEFTFLTTKVFFSSFFVYTTRVISNRGTWGKCKGDKKHCCFHWELIYGLNSGLKQR